MYSQASPRQPCCASVCAEQAPTLQPTLIRQHARPGRGLVVVAIVVVALLAPLSCGTLQAQIDPMALLKRADQARGGGLPGAMWEVQVSNTGNDIDAQPMRLRIKAAGRSSASETLEPLRSKGTRMLQVGRNMWLTKPGLKKPVPLSPRQRLTGQAAIGDIAATNYVNDYTAKIIRDELIEKERCTLLELTSTNRQTTYERLLYWVSVERGVGVQAEFYSLSGKKLKSARFEYANEVAIQGKTGPFISSMTIRDALTDAVTKLDYSHIKVDAIAPAEFDVSHLE